MYHLRHHDKLLHDLVEQNKWTKTMLSALLEKTTKLEDGSPHWDPTATDTTVNGVVRVAHSYAKLKSRAAGSRRKKAQEAVGPTLVHA